MAEQSMPRTGFRAVISYPSGRVLVLWLPDASAVTAIEEAAELGAQWGGEEPSRIIIDPAA